MNMWLTDAADRGCGSGLDFAPMYAMRSVGQCDDANDYRHEYQHECGLWTLEIIINKMQHIYLLNKSSNRPVNLADFRAWH